jgi:putative addiction module component (TIGR02574 family)
MNKTTLRKELMGLTPAERIELACDLWDSIAPEDMPPLTADQIEAIEQEAAAHEKDPTATVPWEEVRTWLRSRPI